MSLVEKIKSQDAIAIMIEADRLYDSNQYDAAIDCYNEAASLFLADSVYVKFQEAIIQIAYSNFYNGDFQAVINIIDYWMPLFKMKMSSYDASLTGKGLLMKAVSYRQFGKYGRALESYNEALNMFSMNCENSPNFAFAYKNAAAIYTRRLDYDKALTYLLKSLECDSTNLYQGLIYGSIANNYFFIGDFDNSLKYFRRGLKCDLSDEDLAFLLFVGGKAYFEKGKLDTAVFLMRRAVELYSDKPNYLKDKVGCIISLSGMLKNKRYANELLTNTIGKLKNDFQIRGREVASAYFQLGENYMAEMQLDSALAHYQLALIQLFPNFNSTNIADNPGLKDVYTESWIMTAAARKAEALHLRYQLHGNMDDLKNAAYCFDLSLAAVKELNKSYGSDAAKLYMGDYSHNYWEEAIEVNYVLHSKTGSSAYLDKIFTLMEKSKASVLSEAIQKNRALLLMGIPDSLLEREKDLRITIAELTTQLRNTEVEGQDPASELAKIKGQLSDAQLEHERLLEMLKNEYPNFRAFIEESPIPTLAEAKASLAKDGQVFAEFFSGERAIYCLYFDSKRANIFSVARNKALDAAIQEYSGFFKDANAILAAPDAYLCIANELFDLLFAKIIAQNKPQKVVLALDGILGFLPFDALVVNANGAENGFYQVDYLIKNLELHYAYSANVLLQQMENHQHNGDFLRIMPRFANGERGLAPLSYSDEETAGVVSWISLDGKNATKLGFRDFAEKSRLIHLSTHADADNKQGEPYIELADGRLTLSELYAMNLNATDLVILSACETGLGKLEKGEGVMSLARGFAYAGANSLVASLWKVNERSTALLFHRFYLYLKEGKTKSEALRLAKLWALENAGTDARRSPYYWAGFVFIGNDNKVDLPMGWPKWLFILPLAVVGLAAGIFYARRKHRPFIA